jgi:hypothetical protein
MLINVMNLMVNADFQTRAVLCQCYKVGYLGGGPLTSGGRSRRLGLGESQAWLARTSVGMAVETSARWISHPTLSLTFLALKHPLSSSDSLMDLNASRLTKNQDF